jgi:hypothetical protein
MRIVVAHHHRQRDQAHRHHGSAEDACGRSKQRAHEHDRNAQTAGDRTKQLRHRDKQVFSDLRALQHDAHEHEQRNGYERISLNLPVNPPEIGHPRTEPLRRRALRKVCR